MLDRRKALLAIAAAAAGTATGVAAQSPTGMPVVGFMALASRDAAQIEALEQGLRENGLVPGRDVAVAARFADGSRERADAGIAELVALGAKVFVAGGPNVVRMIQQRSREAAIVVASLESLQVAGVAGTIARPGGNVTGFATQVDELIGKWLELLGEVVPGLKRVAFISNPGNRNQEYRVAGARKAAAQLGLVIEVVEIGSEADVEAKLLDARAAGAQAAVHPRDFLFESMRPRMVAASNAAQLPSIYDEATFVALGGLISYSPDRPDLFRRSASHVAKILKGVKPADIPIEQPVRFELAVNLKTARALGLTIPPSILIRADEVIE